MSEKKIRVAKTSSPPDYGEVNTYDIQDAPDPEQNSQPLTYKYTLDPDMPTTDAIIPPRQTIMKYKIIYNKKPNRTYFGLPVYFELDSAKII
jgi:hypothetical protein